MPFTIPTAYREIEFTIDNKQVKIAGLAHPVRYNKGYLIETLNYLKDHGFNTLISLDEKGKPPQGDENYGEDYKLLETTWVYFGSTHYYIDFVDESTPTISMYNDLFNYINASISANRQVAIHCGAGAGRTGTMLTALALYEHMQQLYKTNPTSFKSYIINKEDYKWLELQGGNECYCSPVVHAAINKIRSFPNSIGSVEQEDHVQSLMLLEQTLVEQYKARFEASQVSSTSASAVHRPLATIYDASYNIRVPAPKISIQQKELIPQPQISQKQIFRKSCFSYHFGCHSRQL